MPQYTKSVLEEQLKKGEGLGAVWPWRLLLFMIIILGLLTFIYAAVILGYEPYLNSQTKSLDQKIDDLNKQAESDQAKSLIGLYSQLVNIQNILRSHRMPSKLPRFLESNTDSNVYYSNLNLLLIDQSLRLDGIATDYNALVRQLELFRRQPEIKSVLLTGSTAREDGGIQFSIRMIISPDFLK